MSAIVLWIPVSQSLPDDDTEVLLHFATGTVVPGFIDGKIWRFTCGARIWTPVKHWAEFPEPPKP